MTEQTLFVHPDGRTHCKECQKLNRKNNRRGRFIYTKLGDEEKQTHKRRSSSGYYQRNKTEFSLLRSGEATSMKEARALTRIMNASIDIKQARALLANK
jgi:hypothetical protein